MRRDADESAYDVASELYRRVIGALVIFIVLCAIAAALVGSRIEDAFSASCERHNETIREPLREWVQAYVTDERAEGDDPGVVRAGLRAISRLNDQPCEDLTDGVVPLGL